MGMHPCGIGTTGKEGLVYGEYSKLFMILSYPVNLLISIPINNTDDDDDEATAPE